MGNLKDGECVEPGCDNASAVGDPRCGIHAYAEELREDGTDVEVIIIDSGLAQRYGTRYIVGDSE